MLEKVLIATEKNRYQLNDIEIKNGKYVVDLSLIKKNNELSFAIEFVFNNPIQRFRNHDYTWVDCKKDRVATEFSPKIIKLSNNILVQSNTTNGIWEVKKSQPKSLFWKFNPENAYPIVNYVGSKNEKKIIQAENKINWNVKLELLFPKTAIEISRSPFPFSAIVCFTDHCDFDTIANLKTQREFLKEHSIKVTKGYFLNHFSKREDNASFENDVEELNRWKDDGHELAFHSLSQSIKSTQESFRDFETFIPPYSKSPTWIDHGYQPYNLTMYVKSKKSEAYFSDIMKEKGITILWNYIDTGTATSTVVNQINPYDFTLHNFYKGTRNLKFINRISQLIKNIVFHYYGDEKLIVKYKMVATAFKEVVFKKNIKSIPSVLSSFFGIVLPLSKVFFKWNSVKYKPFKNAKYTPLFFKHFIGANEFTIFQTLEIIDFKKSLCKRNVDKLIAEKGIFIGHTYFSAPMKYHFGKMINSVTNSIDDEVVTNFQYLGNKVNTNEIWNPTLKELIDYLSNFDKITFDLDANGDSILVENYNFNFRKVNL